MHACSSNYVCLLLSVWNWIKISLFEEEEEDIPVNLQANANVIEEKKEDIPIDPHKEFLFISYSNELQPSLWFFC